MIPEHSWNQGQLPGVTHRKVQNVIADYLRYLSPGIADRYREISRRALATREMFSYRFPAQGLNVSFASIIPELKDEIDLCQFIAETSQHHSECVQSAFKGFPSKTLSNASEALGKFFEYEHKSLDAIVRDDEDWYRLWQFARHSNVPLSLHLTARPGLVEDFFGPWTPQRAGQKDVDQYNPTIQTCGSFSTFPDDGPLPGYSIYQESGALPFHALFGAMVVRERNPCMNIPHSRRRLGQPSAFDSRFAPITKWYSGKAGLFVVRFAGQLGIERCNGVTKLLNFTT